MKVIAAFLTASRGNGTHRACPCKNVFSMIATAQQVGEVLAHALEPIEAFLQSCKPKRCYERQMNQLTFNCLGQNTDFQGRKQLSITSGCHA